MSGSNALNAAERCSESRSACAAGLRAGGDPGLERALRVQGNTLDWLPIFLPALWMFALYHNDRLAALLGVLWIAGRVLYALAYWAGKNRGPGFAIQAVAAFILLFGAAAGALNTLMVTGGS